MKKYIVLIGDIEGSRSLSPGERSSLQQQLQLLFREIPAGKSGLISPYTITLGDEFQAVYSRADNLFHHIWKVMAELHPVRVRWSASIGEITTPLNRDQSIGMDGPAFYTARNGIDFLKKNGGFFRLSSGDEPFDKMVCNAFVLLDSQLRGWKLNRFKILHTLYEGQDVKETAQNLGISEVAVYKNINAGSLNAIRGFTDSLSLILNEKTG
jgi:hypothetical protein